MTHEIPQVLINDIIQQIETHRKYKITDDYIVKDLQYRYENDYYEISKMLGIEYGIGVAMEMVKELITE